MALAGNEDVKRVFELLRLAEDADRRPFLPPERPAQDPDAPRVQTFFLMTSTTASAEEGAGAELERDSHRDPGSW